MENGTSIDHSTITRRVWIHLSRLRLVSLKTEKLRVSNSTHGIEGTLE